MHAFPKIKDHLCLLVCKIVWGDIGNKTNLFSIRENILCRDSSVFSETGLDYCSALAFKVSFNNPAALSGVKSTRPPNTHCHIPSFCQIISFCLCTLFAIKKHQAGAWVFSAFCLWLYVAVWAASTCVSYVHSGSALKHKVKPMMACVTAWLISVTNKASQGCTETAGGYFC